MFDKCSANVLFYCKAKETRIIVFSALQAAILQNIKLFYSICVDLYTSI